MHNWAKRVQCAVTEFVKPRTGNWLMLVLLIPAIANGRELPYARIGEAYEYSVGYHGLVEPVKVQWQGLPNWLKAEGTLLQGTPPGTYDTAQDPLDFSVTLTGQLGKQVTARYSLKVNPAIRPLELVKSPLPPIPLGEPVSIPLAARGGEGRLQWQTQWIEGIPGIDVETDSETGAHRLIGVARSEVRFQFSTVVRDEAGASDKHTFHGEVHALAAPLRITTTNLPTATLACHYYARFAAEGGRPPYSWTIQWQASPPPGLRVVVDEGRIEGTPTHLGTYPYTITLADAYGTQVRADAGLTVVAPEFKAYLVERKLPTATIRRAFEATLCAGGLIGDTKWTISGAPSWLHWESTDPVVCRLSGVPTEAGTWDISATLSVTAPALTASGESVQEIGKAARNFTLRALPRDVPPLKLIQVRPPVAVQNLPFQYCFATEGGEEPIRFTYPGGLPDSITKGPKGIISTEAMPKSGVFKFAVMATSEDGQQQRFDTELRVIRAERSEPLTISDMRGLNGLFFRKTSFPVPVRGGVSPYDVDIECKRGLERLPSDANESLSFRLCYPFGVPATIIAYDSSGRRATKEVRIYPVVPLIYLVIAVISPILLYAAKVYFSFRRRGSLALKKAIRLRNKQTSTNEDKSK